ncbi:MAG: ATP-binding domain-containing protein, partial [Gemmatimonadota bacterium]|nr:ATP-binding domain-containing protein [Gemmatimonadota bacterium]
LCHHTDPDDGEFHIFFDANQAIYTRSFAPPAGMVRCNLAENHRNPRTVCELLHSVCDTPITTRLRDSRPIERVATDGAESLVKATRRTLHRIINEDAVPPGEVAILTVRKAEDSILAREDKLGNFRLHIGRPGSRRAPGKISLYSIHRFKGLESDVVLLIVEEPGHKPRQPLNDLIYIGASRARGHLVLLGREATLHQLHEGAAAGVE